MKTLGEGKRQEWLKERKKSIGASELPTILGQNPYQTPLMLWKEKTSEEIDERENEYIVAGLFLEKGIADIFIYYNSDFEIIEESIFDKFIKHPTKKVHATYDFKIRNKNTGELCLLEIKNTSKNLKEAEERHLTQLNVQLYLTGLKRGFLCYLLPTKKILSFEVSVDEKTAEKNIEIADNFYRNFVEKGIKPKPLTRDDINFIEVSDDNFYVDEKKEIDKLIDTLQRVKDDIKKLEKAKKDLEGKILNLSNGASIVFNTEGQKIVEVKNIKKSMIDTKKLKEEKPEIFEKYQKSVSYNILKIAKK